MNEVNLELNVLYEAHRLEEVEALYQEMLDELFAMMEIHEYAAMSYKNDAVHYGRA